MPLFCFAGLAAGEHPRGVNDDANRGSHFASKAMGARSRSPRAKIFAKGETPRLIKHRTVTEEFCEMLRQIKSKTSSKIQERLPEGTPISLTQSGKLQKYAL